MARIRIILEDDDGREIAGAESCVYELGRELVNLHEIEGGVGAVQVSGAARDYG